jgi:hypothetical protein
VVGDRACGERIADHLENEIGFHARLDGQRDTFGDGRDDLAEDEVVHELDGLARADLAAVLSTLAYGVEDR